MKGKNSKNEKIRIKGRCGTCLDRKKLWLIRHKIRKMK